MGDKENKPKTQSDILGEANKILEELNEIVDRAASESGKDVRKEDKGDR